MRGASVTGGIVVGVPRVPSGAPVRLDQALSTGASGRAEQEVADEDTARALGTADVPVLATPRLIAWCEQASCRAIAGRLPAELTTVASRVQFDHFAPAPVGAQVTADATLERVEGRRLIFTVSARLRTGSHDGLIGAGRLTRVVVDRAAFLAKAYPTGD